MVDPSAFTDACHSCQSGMWLQHIDILREASPGGGGGGGGRELRIMSHTGRTYSYNIVTLLHPNQTTSAVRVLDTACQGWSARVQVNCLCNLTENGQCLCVRLGGIHFGDTSLVLQVLALLVLMPLISACPRHVKRRSPESGRFVNISFAFS